MNTLRYTVNTSDHGAGLQRLADVSRWENTKMCMDSANMLVWAVGDAAAQMFSQSL